ncbi:MAG: hypothetical protein ACPGJI_00910 [Kangiellaceae bacterium]
MSVKRKNLIKLFAGAFTLLAAGCGYSDYSGHPGHTTHTEAYVPAWGTVISDWDEDWDGTYVYTVDYDHQKWMKKNFQFDIKITAYRNEVLNSNISRPNIFPSGAGFEGATGFAGGTYSSYWIAHDMDPNSDGGEANFDQSQPLDADGNWIAPGLILIADAPEQEVDGYDWDLQTGIKNASAMLSSIIANGGSIEGLSLGLNAISLNNQKFNIDTFNVGFSSIKGQNQILIKRQPSAKMMIKTILDNTPDMKRVDLVLHFDNGMDVATPKGLAVMFNHKALAKFAK